VRQGPELKTPVPQKKKKKRKKERKEKNGERWYQNSSVVSFSSTIQWYLGLIYHKAPNYSRISETERLLVTR
jgi:hypothetical protein